MSIERSDNRLELHPKPVQEWERKLVGGVYVDWSSTAEIDSFYTTGGLSSTYKLNKYFWVAGILYQYTLSGYRQVGGNTGGVSSIPYRVTETSNTVTIPGLIGKEFVFLIQASQVYDADQISLNDETGELDGSAIGGFYEGYLLTIMYK